MKSISISLIIVACLGLIFSVIRGQNDLILSDQAVDDDSVSSIPDQIEEPLNGERFVPSHEWQVVKKNQAIPAGLHVRMNFETGIREAKLMDDDDRGNSNVRHQDKSKENEPLKNNKKEKTGPKIILADDLLNSEEGAFLHDKLVFKKSHLKQALNDFKDKIGTKDVEHVTWSDDAKDVLKETMDLEKHVEQKKKNFRSMEEIKAELEGSMGWNIKSDVQIMRDIVDLLKSDKKTREEKMVALDSLEDYAHQIDNGKDLEKIGGLKVIVNMLNKSDEIMQEKAANVIGAAAQSNKEVQEAVYNHGGLNFLLRMLDNSKQTLTQKKGLYALSAVIRGDQHVQTEFVKLGGLKSILQIVKQSPVTALKVKAVTLLYDLIVEQDEVMQKMIQTGKRKISERSPLLISLTEAGWCNELIPLLKTKDYDAREKVIQALVVSVSSCSQTLNKHLHDLRNELKTLEGSIKTEDDADFKSYLVSLKDQLDKNVIQKLKLLSE